MQLNISERTLRDVLGDIVRREPDEAHERLTDAKVKPEHADEFVTLVVEAFEEATRASRDDAEPCTGDDEADVIARCAIALDAIEPESATRVIEYLCERFDDDDMESATDECD